MGPDLTIVFIGFDGYRDLWDDCVDLFHRFWPDCPYPVVFVNNTADVAWDNVTVLHAGDDAEWSRKVQLALEECGTPYICLLLEDFFLGEAVSGADVDALLACLKENRISYCKIKTNRHFRDRNPLFRGHPHLHVIPQSDGYGVSLQPSIWEREYLKTLLGEGNYNAWNFEFDRVKEAQGRPDLPREGCVSDDRNILHIQHGVIQGKWIPGTVSYFKKRGIELNTTRGLMSAGTALKREMMSLGKELLPRRLEAPVKSVLEKLGMKFVSTVRQNRK